MAKRRRSRRAGRSPWVWIIGAAALAVIALPIYTNATTSKSNTALGEAPRLLPQTSRSNGASSSAPGNAASTGDNGATATVQNTDLKSTSGQQETSGSSAPSQTNQQNQSDVNTPVLVNQAFAASQAKMATTEVHSWTMVNHNFVSTQELETIATTIEKEFPLEQAKSVQRTDKTEHFYEIYGQRAPGVDVTIVVSSFQFQNAPNQTILIVRADSLKPNPAQLTAEYKQIAQAQRQEGLSPQISACIKGFISAKISGGLTTALENRVFQAVDAKRVEGITTSNVTSISGYSPKSANYIMTNHHKMNLQLGLHYDNQTHETEIIVGAPYITITY